MLRHLLSWATNLAVLGTLAGLAFWGHETDWTFVHLKPHDPHHKSEPHPSQTVPVAAAPARDSAVVLANPDSAAIVGIQTAAVSVRTLPETLDVHGQVTYVQSQLAQLSARVPGIVWSVEKEVGDEVREGEILAILDSVDVGQAKAEFLESLVEAELQRKNLQRIEATPEAISERLRRETEAAWRQARVACYNAQQKLINLGLPVRVDELQGMADEARAAHIRFLGLPAEFLVKHNPETTTANLIPLRASFDGVVIAREITPGEVVMPEQPQLTIADCRTMWIQLDIHKEDTSRIRIGQPVEFLADGLPASLKTELSWISTEVDLKTRTVRAIAEVENPILTAESGTKGKRLLEANLFGTGRVRVRDKANVTVVPRGAVVWSGNRHLVFVPAPRPDNTSLRYEPRPVETGLVTDDGFVEIVSGLTAGDQVVVSGADLLKSELALRQLREGDTVARQP